MNYKELYQIFLIIALISSCAVKEPTIYVYESYEYNWLNRTEDAKRLYTKRRFKYDKFNDSIFAVTHIIDSIQVWDSIHYSTYRDTTGMSTGQIISNERIWEIEDSLYKALRKKIFNDTLINERSKIIYLNPVENDTLTFDSKRKYSGLNVYSFVCSSCREIDSGYIAFLCDSIGIIAVYASPWHMLTILDKVENNNEIDLKAQRIKSELMNDSIFFPLPWSFIAPIVIDTVTM